MVILSLYNGKGFEGFEKKIFFTKERKEIDIFVISFDLLG